MMEKFDLLLGLVAFVSSYFLITDILDRAFRIGKYKP
jgi:hypothetical protein